MEQFLHSETLIIFKRQLAEAKTDAQRDLLLKLLAQEEARGGPLTDGPAHLIKSDELPAR